ncbi:MFS transporter [Nocardioides sp.]|jgi:predicted MFS family arabinose efflux permease|uniref:MFS transporter n=1 Tax=Nocardioides sp. TaxID=35761 RepID=UPI002F40A8EA
MAQVIGDRVAPPRLGGSFRWLLASSWTSNLGDGLALAAGPLLVASQTHEPFLVALAALLQRLPWLLFGLYAGALADRVDRRRMVMVCDALRVVVLAVLALAIGAGDVDIRVVLVAMLLIGLTELFSDSAARTLLPMLVRREDLGIGNARLMTGTIALNQLAGPPLGAFLFAAGMALPFVTQAVCVGLGVVLIAKVATPPGAVRDLEGTHVRQDIVDGIRWLMGHSAVRTLALVILTFNVTWAAAWAVLVLYSTQVLGMGPVGFGLLTTAAAVGGLVSTTCYGWLEQHIGLATLMRGCLTLEVLMHLAFAVNRSPVIAFVIMFGFGSYAFVWATVSQTVRQRVVPTEYQGRVGSVYSVGLYGGIVIGQALGGAIAGRWGLTAPFWFAFVGSGITLILIWRALAYIAHADVPPDSVTP